MNHPLQKTKKQKFLLSTVVVIFFILALSRWDAVFSPVRGVLNSLFAPLEKAATVLSHKIVNTKGTIASIGTFKERVSELTQQNNELRVQNEQLRTAAKENDELRRTLALPEHASQKGINADVVARDPHRSGTWIMINRGGKDAIAKGFLVVTLDGILVGVVDEVFYHTARVILLTHPASSINAVVNETGAQGIVRGEHGLSLILDNVLQEENVQQGAAIVTSDIGGRVQKGIYIGTVGEVAAQADDLFQRATIVASVDSARLQFVSVIR